MPFFKTLQIKSCDSNSTCASHHEHFTKKTESQSQKKEDKKPQKWTNAPNRQGYPEEEDLLKEW